jgi:RNA polymerase sigma-70 factor, ECF subfamily
MDLDPAAPDPEGVVIAAERRAELLAAIGTLRDEDREILGTRFFLDLSEAEAAEALGLARGTIKSRTSRALGRLRAAMTEGGDG